MFHVEHSCSGSQETGKASQPVQPSPAFSARLVTAISIPSDVLTNKAASIERPVARAKEDCQYKAANFVNFNIPILLEHSDSYTFVINCAKC